MTPHRETGKAMMSDQNTDQVGSSTSLKVLPVAEQN